MELEELAKKYALKNAVDYEGECNPGAVIGKIMNEEDFDPEEVQSTAGKICGQINRLSLEEQREQLEQYEFEEEEHEHDPIPDLDVDEDEEVVLRFAPNPNGPPHVGHARGMVINGELKQKYDGKLILRYDDTDPETKRPLKNDEYDAYKMIREDYEWLGYEIDETVTSSENFDKYIEYAEQLIEKGKAYVCECSQEEGRKYRKEGTECPHRSRDAEVNMELWEEMKKGGLEEGEAVLKIKTDMQHKNPAVRDFVAFRIIDNPQHPITGNSYRVWPMLDFQGAIEDHLCGTTHIFRGKDLRASRERQKYIYEYFGWEYPEVRHWGNVKISGFNAPVSGSELSEMIEEGDLDGWDDPRAPTLRALKKRGFRPEALKNFYIEMGVTEKDIEASVENMESHNREELEESSDRYYFVKNPVKLEVEDVPEDIELHLPKHPDFPDRGERSFEVERSGDKLNVYIEEQDLEEGFLRLKGLFNVEVTEPKSGKADYREGDHKVAMEKDGSIIHWVPENYKEAELIMPDNNRFNGFLEPENRIEDGEVVQFERIGFVKKQEGSNTFYFTHS